jgi:hypothetical protein
MTIPPQASGSEIQGYKLADVGGGGSYCIRYNGCVPCLITVANSKQEYLQEYCTSWLTGYPQNLSLAVYPGAKWIGDAMLVFAAEPEEVTGVVFNLQLCFCQLLVREAGRRVSTHRFVWTRAPGSGKPSPHFPGS